jgi:preprotein translocase subunit YajC
MNRGRKQQRRVADLQAGLVPGQRVVTTAGLYARVVEVGDTTIVLEPAEGVRTTWARQAVARLVEDDAVPTGVAEDAEPTPSGPDPTRPAGAVGTTSLVKGSPPPATGPTGPAGGATAAGPDAPERPER